MSSICVSGPEVKSSTNGHLPCREHFPVGYPTDPRHLRAIEAMHELVEALAACEADESLPEDCRDDIHSLGKVVSNHIGLIEQEMPDTLRPEIQSILKP
jgi:hypothetical protein